MHDHTGDIKQFVLLSEAWYGDANLKPPTRPNPKPYLRHVDSVTFGYYSPDGGTSGEMSVNWYVLEEEDKPPAACLECWDDGWHALSTFKDVLAMLALFADKRAVTPQMFCALLIDCGFIDATPRQMAC